MSEVRSQIKFIGRLSNPFDIGAQSGLTEIERRHLRVTNIGATIATIFMLCWTVFAYLAIDRIEPAVINGIGAVLFGLTLLMNHLGHRVMASVYLILVIFLQLFIQVYLYGYPAGVHFICLVLVIVPYVTIAKEKRWASHLFAALSCITWVVIILFRESIPAHFEVLDPKLHFTLNATFILFTCVLFLMNMSNTIDLAENSLTVERNKIESLLHNILPKKIASELKETGETSPRHHDNVTILFTDFKGFTALAEQLSAKELVDDLNVCFSEFDRIMGKYGIEKIKTIGDAYMAAGGLPTPDSNHAQNVINAALEMRDFVDAGKAKKTQQGLPYFAVRIGVHTGPVVAGIVGIKKFQYDIWGDTVNTASRMESSGEVGKVNISETTYELIKDEFLTMPRGEIEAKGKGKVKMFFVEKGKT